MANLDHNTSIYLPYPVVSIHVKAANKNIPSFGDAPKHKNIASGLKKPAI
jgi:hypothetical protein